MPLYRVMVRLRDQTVRAYGQPVALRPGMALHADILLDRRRLIQWVLEPALWVHSADLVRTPPTSRVSANGKSVSAGVHT